jgi:hypothetical protein
MSTSILRSESSWTKDDNSSSHQTIVLHNLGKLPDTVTIYFVDQVGSGNISLVQWSWDPGYTGNPCTIQVNRDAVILNIDKGRYLHGRWNPDNGQWTRYTEGFWKVICTAQE